MTKTALPQVGSRGERPDLRFLVDVPTRLWNSPKAGHFFAELRGSTHSDLARPLTFRLPYVPEANQQIARRVGILPKDLLRTQVDGVALVCEPDERVITQRAAFGDELIPDVFSVAAITATLSDKGRYSERIVRHLGGLQKGRAFKIPGVRRLLERTMAAGTLTASSAKQEILGRSARGSELARFGDVVLQPGQRHPLTNDMVWDYLLRKRVFLPGAELKCEECALQAWLSIDDLKSVIDCPYCAASLVTGPLLKSNHDWKYRRSPLFSVEDSLHGAIPVLLTLMQLHTLFSSDMLAWCTSLDLTPTTGGPCETDFAAITSHTFQPTCLAIGECKTNLEFSEADLRNLLRVSDSFRMTDVEVYVVFSKLAKFTEAELSLIRGVPTPTRERIVLLDVDDLEPYEPFRGGKHHPIDMDRLARASAEAHAY